MPKLFDHCYRCGTDDPGVFLPKSQICRPCLKARYEELKARGGSKPRVYGQCCCCGAGISKSRLNGNGACRTCSNEIRQKAKLARGRCYGCNTTDPEVAINTKGYCRACDTQKSRDYYWRNRDRLVALGRKWHADNIERVRAYNRRKSRSLKIEALNAYGGQCACCGESRWEFLAIDHVNGGGKKHRMQASGVGKQFYAWLRRQGWPQGELRVLCHSCNVSLGMYGYCPHRPDLRRGANAGIYLAELEHQG